MPCPPMGGQLHCIRAPVQEPALDAEDICIKYINERKEEIRAQAKPIVVNS